MGSNSSGRSSDRKSSGERRREIAATALQILAAGGLHQLTTAALAERVGLAERTIFESPKEDGSCSRSSFFGL